MDAARRRHTAIAAVVFVATGAWIFYTRISSIPIATSGRARSCARNTRRPSSRSPAKPQPKIVGVKVAADIFPYEHRAQFKGTFTLRNKSAGPIPSSTCKSTSWRR